MIAFNYRWHLISAYLITLNVTIWLGLPVQILILPFFVLLWQLSWLSMLAVLIFTFSLGNTISGFLLMGIFMGFDLPDIDISRSWISHRLLGLGHVIGRLISHRGITHSLFALVFLTAISASLDGVLRIPWSFTLGLGVSYLTHLLGDYLYNPQCKHRSPGIQLWWPSKRKVRAMWTDGHPWLTKLLLGVFPFVFLIMQLLYSAHVVLP